MSTRKVLSKVMKNEKNVIFKTIIFQYSDMMHVFLIYGQFITNKIK